jgi:uncharacterized protein YkwD
MQIDPGRGLRPVASLDKIAPAWRGAVIIDDPAARGVPGYYVAELFDAAAGEQRVARHMSARRLNRFAQDIVSANLFAEQITMRAEEVSYSQSQPVIVLITQLTPATKKGAKRASGRDASTSIIIEDLKIRVPSAPAIPTDSTGQTPGKPRYEATPISNLAEARAQVISLTNQARATETDCGVHGRQPAVGPLVSNAELTLASQRYAELMARHGHFGHTGPDGTNPSQRARAAGYKDSAGENLARGQRNAQQVVDGWLRSDGHCKNLMINQYRVIGVGVADDNRGNRYWVQMFGATL